MFLNKKAKIEFTIFDDNDMEGKFQFIFEDNKPYLIINDN